MLMWCMLSRVVVLFLFLFIYLFFCFYYYYYYFFFFFYFIYFILTRGMYMYGQSCLCIRVCESLVFMCVCDHKHTDPATRYRPTANRLYISNYYVHLLC